MKILFVCIGIFVICYLISFAFWRIENKERDYVMITPEMQEKIDISKEKYRLSIQQKAQQELLQENKKCETK